jgi:hypothetical protein
MKTLDQFLHSFDHSLWEQVNGWSVVRDVENSDIVRLKLPARDGETYIIRCKCDGYPALAPSVKFVNAEGSENDKFAWPSGDAEFGKIVKPPPHCFLCMPLTREGLQHHQDWLQAQNTNPWNADKHSLQDVFNFLKRILHEEHYLGRTKA